MMDKCRRRKVNGSWKRNYSVNWWKLFATNSQLSGNFRFTIFKGVGAGKGATLFFESSMEWKENILGGGGSGVSAASSNQPLTTSFTFVPRGGGQTAKVGCANLLFLPIFPQNCMKLKKFGPRGGGGVSGAPLDRQWCHYKRSSELTPTRCCRTGFGTACWVLSCCLRRIVIWTSGHGLRTSCKTWRDWKLREQFHKLLWVFFKLFFSGVGGGEFGSRKNEFLHEHAAYFHNCQFSSAIHDDASTKFCRLWTLLLSYQSFCRNFLNYLSDNVTKIPNIQGRMISNVAVS